MSFELEKILEAKKARRRELAARPIAEKLCMLDALRERAVILRKAGRKHMSGSSTAREEGERGETT